jgi:acyl-CoA synthetase (AMP-forming)/AMP-acid ligase II
MMLQDILRRACARTPNKVFLFCDDEEITYREADRLSDAIASAFAEWGMRPGDRIDVVMANSIDAVLVCLASWKAGVLPVMVNPGATPEDLEYYATLATPSVVIYDDELDAEMRRLAAGARAVSRSSLQTLKHGRASQTAQHEVVDEELGCNISFTTGTTGRPKGVVLMHGPLALATSCIAERMALSAEDVILHPGPLYSSFHLVAMLLPGIHRCSTMGLQSTWDPGEAWRLVEERHVTVFTAYPMILADFVEYAREHQRSGGTLRLAMSGGSTTALEIKRRYRQHLGVPLIESYGQSELGGFFALGDPREAVSDDLRQFPTGRALPDKIVAILDDDDHEVPVGACGEIALRGGYMQGYWNAPDQSALALRGGWLHSGDLGRMDADGFITLLCRKGDQVERQGQWTSVRELEETLYAHPAVEHAAAITMGDQSIVAYVSLFDAAVSAADLQAYAQARVPPELRPRSVEILDVMPRTSSGKLNKPALKALAVAAARTAV